MNFCWRNQFFFGVNFGPIHFRVFVSCHLSGPRVKFGPIHFLLLVCWGDLSHGSVMANDNGDMGVSVFS